MDRYQTADGIFVEAHPDDVRAASREMERRMPPMLPDPDGVADAFAHGLACLEELKAVREAGARAIREELLFPVVNAMLRGSRLS